MKAVVIIPARFASTRFEGKPLVDLLGKPMIRHVYERCLAVGGVDKVLVATDDKRIYDAVRGFGGEAVMTSADHPTGTDRLAEVARGLHCDLVVNVQGDEPLIDPEMVSEALAPLMADPSIPMGTLKSLIGDERELHDPAVVKVVTDRNDFALYFSRSPIPFVRDGGGEGTRHYRHVGLYVYNREFLLQYARMAPTPLECAEKLEQLRALENGHRIKVVTTRHETHGVDRPEDLEKVKEILKERSKGE